MILSHDVQTMSGFAGRRVRAGQPMPGLVQVQRLGRFAAVVYDLLVVAACDAAEIDGQVWFVPLR